VFRHALQRFRPGQGTAPRRPCTRAEGVSRRGQPRRRDTTRPIRTESASATTVSAATASAMAYIRREAEGLHVRSPIAPDASGNPTTRPGRRALRHLPRTAHGRQSRAPVRQGLPEAPVPQPGGRRQTDRPPHEAEGIRSGDGVHHRMAGEVASDEDAEPYWRAMGRSLGRTAGRSSRTLHCGKVDRRPLGRLGGEQRVVHGDVVGSPPTCGRRARPSHS